MKTLLVVAVAAVATLLVAGDYVPGQPGAPWSLDEIFVVRSKLFSLYKYRWASKALRLGFHDCLKYADGTGGCDGCLNWKGVGIRYENATFGSRSETNVEATDNNGLEEIVERLEKVYREPDFPMGSPKLGTSLFKRGKSRADLWAFAAIVATEYGMETTNIACKDRKDPRVLQVSCVHDPNEEKCFVRPERPLRFETGRSDCTDHDPVDTYKTTKKEHHPNPVGNGRSTIEFFKSDFSFNGRETAAIFGAHTFGQPHQSISLFPYTWTSRALNLFNNDYYKSIVGVPRWYFDDDECHRIGDAFKNKPQTRWLAHSKKMTFRGGPVFWIHQNLVCPALYNKRPLSKYDQKCVDEAGPGQLCRPDPPAGGTSPRTPDQPDGDLNQGCEAFRLILGKDEIALNCEMGLYREFEVTEGVIHGCEGLEHFNASMANYDKNNVWSWLPGKGLAEPSCEKQRLAEPAGSTPLYKIMEEFANDQTAWINAFIPALEKMMRNGYSSLLTQAPALPANIQCPLPKAWSGKSSLCYEPSLPDKQFTFKIGNRMGELNGKVYQFNSTSGLFDFAKNTESQNQLWQLSQSGRQMINVGTGMPLAVDANVNYNIEHVGEDFFMTDAVSGRVVDCYKAGVVEGSACITWNRHGGPNQRFYIILPSI